MSIQPVVPAHVEASIAAFRAAAESLVITRVEQLSSKFDFRRYVNRNDPEKVFADFCASPKKLCLILGDSGKGKTNLLCSLALATAKQSPTLFAGGLGLWASSQPVWEYLLAPMYNLRPREVTLDLDAWHEQHLSELQAARESLFVFIDGINETDDFSRAKRELKDLIANARPNVKFVFSCRTDSFRLHFQDPFWASYLYIPDGASEVAPDSDKALKKLRRAARRYIRDRDVRAEIQEALREHQEQLRAAKEQERRRQAIDATFFLSDFTENELAAAEVKYGTRARLVGGARTNAHDPLVFRFFADTFGSQEREVDEVFVVENCRQYLNTVISEVNVRVREKSREQILAAIYQLSQYAAAQRDGLQQVDARTAPSIEQSLVDALIETGMVFLAKRGGAGEELNIVAFTHDRILSFVRARQTFEAGAPAVDARLQALARQKRISDIAVHEAVYLLEFLDGSRSTTLRRHVDRLLRHDTVAPFVIRVFPELASFSTDEVFDRLISVLHSAVTPRTDACADALSTFARGGQAPRVVTAIAALLADADAATQSLYTPLIKPLCVAYEAAPEAIEWIAALAGTRLPGWYDYALRESWASAGLFNTHTEDNGRPELAGELRNFGTARGPLIRALLARPEPPLRASTVAAVGPLIAQNLTAASELVDQLLSDRESSVRAALAGELPAILGIDHAFGIEAARRILADPASEVRAQLASTILTLGVSGVEGSDVLVEALCGDTSTSVRASAARVTLRRRVAARSEQQPILDATLDKLAHDESETVRLAILMAISESAGADVILRMVAATTEDNPTRAIRYAALEVLAQHAHRLAERTESVTAARDAILRSYLDDRSNAMRIRAAAVVADFARAGAPMEWALRQLVADRSRAVRDALLAADAHELVPGLASALETAGVSTPAHQATDRSWSSMCAWSETIRRHMTGSERIRWTAEAMGILAFVLTPLIYIAVGGDGRKFTGLQHPFDPRVSPLPILIGIAAALITANAIRFLALSTHKKVKVRSPLVVLSFVAAGALAGLATGVTLFVITRDKHQAARIGLMVTLGVEIAVALFVDAELRAGRRSWAGQGLFTTVAAGCAGGAIAGLIATWIFDDLFYILIVPLIVALVALPLRPSQEAAIGTGAALGLVVGAAPWLIMWCLHMRPARGLAWFDFLAAYGDGPRIAVAALAAIVTILVASVIFAFKETEEGPVALGFAIPTALGAGIAVFSGVDVTSAIVIGLASSAACLFIPFLVRASDQFSLGVVSLIWLPIYAAAFERSWTAMIATTLLGATVAFAGERYFERKNTFAARSPLYDAFHLVLFEAPLLYLVAVVVDRMVTVAGDRWWFEAVGITPGAAALLIVAAIAATGRFIGAEDFETKVPARLWMMLSITCVAVGLPWLIRWGVLLPAAALAVAFWLLELRRAMRRTPRDAWLLAAPVLGGLTTLVVAAKTGAPIIAHLVLLLIAWSSARIVARLQQGYLAAAELVEP